MEQAQPDILNNLAGNLAAVALVLSLWAHVTTHINSTLGARDRALSIGATCGLAAAVSMLMAVPIGQGIVLDFRNGLIAGGVLVGGPLAGLVAFGVACAMRIAIDGTGANDVIVALTVIFAAGAVDRAR